MRDLPFTNGSSKPVFRNDKVFKTISDEIVQGISKYALPFFQILSSNFSATRSLMFWAVFVYKKKHPALQAWFDEYKSK